MAKAPFTFVRPAGVPEVVERLTAVLAMIPGVGEKTARRHALWFASGDLGDKGPLAVLGQAADLVRAHVRLCPRCRMICDTPPGEVCAICADGKRDASVLCVVASVLDLLAVEKSRAYRGRYFVLGTLVSPLEGVEAKDLPLDALAALTTPGMEVMLALPSSVDGSATVMVIAAALRGTGAKVTTLGQGMPHGGTVEHADQVTVGRAIEGRQEVR